MQVRCSINKVRMAQDNSMIFRCLLILPVVCAAARVSADEYFTIQVVDAATGRGIPQVELFPFGGSTLVSDSNGIVAFNTPSLMGQNVFFGFRSYGYSEWGQTLQTTAGSSVQVAITLLW